MSGSKTIKNGSNVMINVVLRGRVGADPNGGTLPPVAGAVEPGGSKTFQYGNDSNPYLNVVEISVGPTGSQVYQNYICTQRGGAGTLDNLLNANSTLTISYNSGNYGFTLSGGNLPARRPAGVRAPRPAPGSPGKGSPSSPPRPGPKLRNRTRSPPRNAENM